MADCCALIAERLAFSAEVDASLALTVAIFALFDAEVAYWLAVEAEDSALVEAVSARSVNCSISLAIYSACSSDALALSSLAFAFVSDCSAFSAAVSARSIYCCTNASELDAFVADVSASIADC